MKPKTHIVSLIVIALSATTQAQTTLYWGGGSSNIAANVSTPTANASLAGAWDTATGNWASYPVAPNTHQAWVDGSIADFGIFADNAQVAIGLMSDVTLSGVRANAAGNGFNLFFDLNDSTPRVITLAGKATFDVQGRNNTNGFRLGPNISLAGSSGLSKDGSGVLSINSDSNALTGEVGIRSGTVNVGGSGRLAGIVSFDVSGYAPSVTGSGLGGNEGFTSPTLTVGGNNTANNHLADEAEIVLRRGNFTYTNGGASSTETIGKIVLNDAGRLVLSAGNAAGVLTLSDATEGLRRGANGRGTLVVGVPGSADEIPRTNLKITTPGTIPTDTLLPWVNTSRGEFMLIDGANQNTLTRIASTQGATDLSTWSSTYTADTNVRLSNPLPGSPAASTVYGIPLSGAIGNGDPNQAATVSIKTLALIDNQTTTRNSGNTGYGSQTAWQLNIEEDDTLSLASGAIAQRGENNITNRIVGGSLTTTRSQLYVTTLDNNSGGLDLNTNLTGTFDLIKSGIIQVRLAGTSPNTFVGNAYVNEGHLVLDKAGALNGDLILSSGGSAALNNTSALSATSNVFVASEARLSLSNNAVVGGVVTVNGGSVTMPNMAPVLNHAGTGLVFNGGSFYQNSSAPGTLNLQTNVSYASSSNKQAVFEKLNPAGTFNIELDGAERTFAIVNSATLASGTAEMVIEAAIIDGSPSGGSLRKTGTGTMELIGTNTFTGGTVVEEGTLRLSTRSAAAQSGLVGVPGGGASGFILSLKEPIANRFLVGQTISGLNNTRRVAGILNEYDIIMDGSSNQTLFTEISVNAVSRTGSLGGMVTVENGGTLEVGAGSVIGGAVTVNNGGTLSGVVKLDSTLTFASGSKLAVNLGTNSGGVEFTTLADSVSGSGLATLQVTPTAGFSYGSNYTILSNVTTVGFNFVSITGYDTANHTASLTKSGDNYVLSFSPVSGGSPYDTWASGFPGFTPTDASLDFDNDGVANLLEFVFGGDPRFNDSPSIRPTVVASGTDLVVSFKRSDASEGQPVTVKVQVSTDLVTWDPADDIIIGDADGGGPNEATYTVDDTGNIDMIVVTIPKGSAEKRFVRVMATD